MRRSDAGMSGDARRSPGAARQSGTGQGGIPGRDADQAVAALYHAHYRSLVRVGALLVSDGAFAEEIVQDAFVSVHRAWRHLRDGDEALDHLHRAVVSGARSHSAALPDPRGPAGAGRPAPGIPEALLMAAVRALPARQREALVLKYYADWPDPQIAAAMGISRHELNDCIRRGKSALRDRAAPGWSGDA